MYVSMTDHLYVLTPLQLSTQILTVTYWVICQGTCQKLLCLSVCNILNKIVPLHFL